MPGSCTNGSRAAVLRRSYGAAVTDLQAMLGHASLATTQIYARMVDRRTRASVEALDFGV